MLRFLFLACLALGGCMTSSSTNNGCPQPTQPTCVTRAAAWCSTAKEFFTAQTAGDAGLLVPCPDSSGNQIFAVFDGGVRDDAGLPRGCPSLRMVNGTGEVADAATQEGDSCCYPTRVYCA